MQEGFPFAYNAPQNVAKSYLMLSYNGCKGKSIFSNNQQEVFGNPLTNFPEGLASL
jgi:hypothetical protein